MAGKGGKTEGSGRKKGTLNNSYGAIREAINKRMTADERAELMVTLAKGVTVQEIKDGEPVVYTKEPNIKAIELMEGYASGKPAQSVDITTLGERLSLKIVYSK